MVAQVSVARLRPMVPVAAAVGQEVAQVRSALPLRDISKQDLFCCWAAAVHQVVLVATAAAGLVREMREPEATVVTAVLWAWLLSLPAGRRHLRV